MANVSDGGGGGGGGGIFSGAASAARNVGKVVRSSGRRTSRSASRSRRRSSGGGGGGGNSGGNSRRYNSYSSSPQPSPRRINYARPAVGSTSKGTVAPSVPAPKTPPMSLDQWLASDTAFQSQKTNYQKALKDYAAQDAAERQKYGNEYNSSLQKLNVEKGEGQTALNDDYAGRGLMNSGLYADALNDFQKNFSTRQADLERARQSYLSDLTTDKTNFSTQQSIELQKAQQAAAARRAAQLGL